MLTDVTTGEPLTIADHAGKVVFVETMAIWCVNCRSQQADALDALEELNDPDVVYVVLDVEPGESATDLAAYEAEHEWDAFAYAIAPVDVSRALADEFGDLVLNPPATPIMVIGTDGTVTLTEWGHKSTEDLVGLAREHGA
jgi:thiol-disulfide isomerase/thioredoxin